MASINLSSIHQYPIKSCAPVSMTRAVIDELGVTGDRRYLVVDTTGRFITARKHPKLVQLQATLFNGGIALAAEGAATLLLNQRDFPDHYRPVTVWKQTIEAQSCGAIADNWISTFLGVECQLVFFGPRSLRPIRKQPERQVSFADGYPLLLTSTASLEWLQERCAEPFVMEQFRPNIVVTGNEPFSEDSWQMIRIGEVTFQVFSPCERCKLTTLPPRSTTFNPQQEPLRTMLTYRRAHEGGALFGQNVIAQNSGVIEVGMPVEVLEATSVDIVRPVDN